MLGNGLQRKIWSILTKKSKRRTDCLINLLYSEKHTSSTHQMGKLIGSRGTPTLQIMGLNLGKCHSWLKILTGANNLAFYYKVLKYHSYWAFLISSSVI